MASPPSPLPRLFVLGDSISIHYGPHLQQSLLGAFDYSRKEGNAEALLNLDRPQGANAGDSSMTLDFLRASISAGRLHADVLLWNCGLHDIKTNPASGEKQVPIEQYRENLQTIIHIVCPTGIRMVWVRTTPCDERIHNRLSSSFYRFAADVEAYNAAADFVMRAADVDILDLFTFTTKLGSDLFCDHVHFHDPIRKQQAAFIADWLIAWWSRTSPARSPDEAPPVG